MINFSLKKHSVRTPLALFLVVASTVTFWFATAPEARATTVQLCHKKTQTISVIFGSLTWRRHKDHGDPDGPCSTTTAAHFLKPARPAGRQPQSN
jgi:hypothetical protein